VQSEDIFTMGLVQEPT